MLGGLPAVVQQTHCRYVCRTIVRITLTVKIKRGWEQNRETLRLGVGTFPVALPRLFPDRPIQYQDRDKILNRFDRLYFKAHGAGWSFDSQSSWRPWFLTVTHGPLFVCCVASACIWGVWRAKRKSPLIDFPGPPPESFLLGKEWS